MSYLVKYGGKAVIHILVEESYRDNNRTDALLQGISAVIKRKRMSIEVHTKIADVPQGVRVVILLCASMAWTVETIEELYGRGIHPLLFGFQNIDTPYAYSCITPSYAKAMYLLTEQLLSKCEKKVAVLGYNMDSLPDRLKLMGIRHAAREHGVDVKVFCNEGDVVACIASFEREGGDAANIVCINDAIAVILHSLYPHILCNRQMCSCSGMKTSEFIRPRWPTSTINFFTAGKYLAEWFLFLDKCDVINSTTMTIDMEILPEAADKIVVHERANRESVDFYRDVLVQEVESVDHMLTQCDALDLMLLADVMDGMGYERIAEKYYLAPNTVKYRISAMVKNAGVNSRKALTTLLKRYGLCLHTD